MRSLHTPSPWPRGACALAGHVRCLQEALSQAPRVRDGNVRSPIGGQCPQWGLGPMQSLATFLEAKDVSGTCAHAQTRAHAHLRERSPHTQTRTRAPEGEKPGTAVSCSAALKADRGPVPSPSLSGSTNAVLRPHPVLCPAVPCHPAAPNTAWVVLSPRSRSFFVVMLSMTA